MSGRFGGLDAAQRAWVDERLPDAELIRDMSWGLVDTTVLHVRVAGEEFVVKAAGPEDTHLPREIAAHSSCTAPLITTGHAALLRDSSAPLRVILLDHLPGELVLGTDAEWQSDTYVQAGELLRRLHEQESRTDADYEARATARALYWLDQPHRVDPAAAARARAVLQAAPAPAVTLVPTHGDWHPRNWLFDRGTVRVIDFGRFAFRPASSDLTRLAAQQWQSHPALERAFFDGYGDDPRDPDLWRLEALRQAVGTACWAHQVGDEAFEAQGHRMLGEALAAY
ncbi:Ser/Thr protein kinase RdoA (MazF antagonist) [Microbacterium sp. W4I4]|uniref:phosphotransferase family protein n=1 Tax=Microbacterium sp. W4I4 TaxID=3042295 RepID=UPI00278AAC73|nr:phosphotransferase [Microbacterium sp. W4I4]MDQ0613165.1 Ser/Thr protein kinase RdoA (MazF antagonist) [Microbacterium sp. W4I4]